MGYRGASENVAVPVKVNVGSGPHSKEDWFNLDWGMLPLLSRTPLLISLLIKLHILPKYYSYRWQNAPRLYDCRKSLPFKANSVDFIYTSHFLEHLYRYEASSFLKECKRILRKNGVLRVSVPDLKLMAEKYVKGDLSFFLALVKPENINFNNIENIADLFMTNFYGHDAWMRPGFIKRLRDKFVRGHHWMYDFYSLKRMLEDAGFKTIKECKAAEGNVPDIDYLDIYRENSLYVEATP